MVWDEDKNAGVFAYLIHISKLSEDLFRENGFTPPFEDVEARSLNPFVHAFDKDIPLENEHLEELKNKWPVLRLPPGVQNPNDPTDPYVPCWHLNGAAALPDDAVITAVIDDGILPFHERFQSANGTRLLGHWEQEGHWAANIVAAAPDTSLISGVWLSANDIQAGVDRANAGMDELQCAQAAHLILDDPETGLHSLYYAQSHGMHVADLAAGMDPVGTTPTDRPLVTVNLPGRRTLAVSGTLLRYFVVHAMTRIVRFVDRLADEQGKSEPWPIVICLAYGQSAGTKDGTDDIGETLALLNEGRASKIQLVMPAGNNNLDKTHITKEIAKNTPFALRWRIRPEDQTTNFCEIWTDRMPEDATWPFDVTIKAPDGSAEELGRPAAVLGKNAYTTPIGTFGFITFRRHFSDRGKMRFQLLVSLAQTQRDGTLNPGVTIPDPGVWAIALKPDKKITIFADIQVDLALRADSQVAKTSEFTDDNYFRHDGWRRDQRDVGDPRQPDQDRSSYLRQRGTANDLAHNPAIIMTAGHRDIDGLPWSGSATGFGQDSSPKGARYGPALSLPVHGGPGTWGQLAAGTRSGSVAAALGTSSATALATRALVDRSGDRNKLLQDASNDHFGPTLPPDQVRAIPTEKLGEGRLALPNVDRDVDRFGRQ